MIWRLCEADGVHAAPGLATDELLLQRVGDGRSPPTLRLYAYRPHCALVGRFQQTANELQLDACTALGIDVNRRPTGGGAILMGPDQLGIALALKAADDERLRGGPRALMQRFSSGLLRGLGILGVDAVFRGKNDLAVGGRKLAGLGICRDAGGGILFHASLLVDLDVALMARVLRLPHGPGAPDERELAVLRTRTTTVRECVGRRIAMTEVRARIAAGFAGAFGTTLHADELAGDEQTGVQQLVRDKYGTSAWVHQETLVADTVGEAAQRTPAGTVTVRVALAGATLKAAQVRGTFFADEAAVADLEGRLRWLALTDGALEQAVAAWSAHWRAADGEEPVPSARAVVQALTAAVERARAGTAAGADRPYGCFVRPEARNT